MRLTGGFLICFGFLLLLLPVSLILKLSKRAAVRMLMNVCSNNLWLLSLSICPQLNSCGARQILKSGMHHNRICRIPWGSNKWADQPRKCLHWEKNVVLQLRNEAEFTGLYEVMNLPSKGSLEHFEEYCSEKFSYIIFKTPWNFLFSPLLTPFTSFSTLQTSSRK